LRRGCSEALRNSVPVDFILKSHWLKYSCAGTQEQVQRKRLYTVEVDCFLCLRLSLRGISVYVWIIENACCIPHCSTETDDVSVDL